MVAAKNATPQYPSKTPEQQARGKAANNGGSIIPSMPLEAMLELQMKLLSMPGKLFEAFLTDDNRYNVVISNALKTSAHDESAF